MIDYQAEERFYSNKFYFSYSSINKLLYAPSLFYKSYVLKEWEDRTDLHLIEGRLLHCLLLDNESFDNQFILTPSSLPSGSIRSVIDNVYRRSLLNNSLELSLEEQKDTVLTVMEEVNFYQKLKTDAQRLEKVINQDTISYYSFLKSKNGKDLVDEETYLRVKEYAEIIKSNKSAYNLLEGNDTSERFSELKLTTELVDYQFGIKGIVDRLSFNNSSCRIIDLKTTSKTLSEFKDTVEFYNYWLQAAIYHTLVKNTYAVNDIEFGFLVIDKYQQVYYFQVSDDTMKEWLSRLESKLKTVNYHYSSRNYTLPYDFCNGLVKL